MSRIIQMFDRAAERLARPKVRIVRDGRRMVLVRYGKKSRIEGAVAICTDGSNRLYLGTVHRDGHLSTSLEWERERLAALVREVEADPVAALSADGRRQGRCSFCAKKLTHPDSLAVGYGPDCADHWGLPWGGGAAR